MKNGLSHQRDSVCFIYSAPDRLPYIHCQRRIAQNLEVLDLLARQLIDTRQILHHIIAIGVARRWIGGVGWGSVPCDR